MAVELGPLLFGIIGSLTGIVVFYSGFEVFKQKRLIENTPTSKIRSLAMGPVEVYGEAETVELPEVEKTVKAPFTGKDCLYCRYTVEEEREHRDKNGHVHRYWATVSSKELFTYFLLKDATGEVLVYPKGAHVDIPSDFRQTGRSFSPQLTKAFDELGIRYKGFLFGTKKLRITEYDLVEGDKLYVFGDAQDNPFVEEATSVKGYKDVMISKGKRMKFFYISDKSEKEVIKSMKWKSILGIVLGPILALVSIAVLLSQMI